MDKFITRKSGKGKLGFPLIETTSFNMGGAGGQMETSIETLEFTTAALDSMLFEIPPGYQEAKNESDLQDRMDAGDMMKDIINQAKQNMPAVNMDVKKPNMIRIAVYPATGNDEVQASALQQRMAGALTGGNIEAIAVANEEEAKKSKCDYSLSTAFSKVKSTNKVGGILKAIKNADPNAASTYNVQGNLSLRSLADGSVRTEQKMDGKYEGKIDDAVGKAADEGCQGVVKALKQ